MSALHFLRPDWFLALIPLLLLLVLLWRRRTQATHWQGIVAPALLPHLLLEAGKPVRRLPLTLLGVGWLLAVTALAGPTWQQQPQAVYRAPSDRVIVLDMSASMAATDLTPDRLTRARLAIRDLLGGLREGRTALVVFSGEHHVVAPLTDDVATIEALLPALSVDIMPAPGNRAAAALRAAGELLQHVGSRRAEVLLVSDGIDDPADSLNAIRALRDRGVPTSVLGVGTLQGAPVPAAGGGFEPGKDGAVGLARLDETGLAALARAGGGRYQRLGQGRLADLVGQGVAHDLAHAQAADHGGVPRWVEEGPWLLLPLLLIAAGGFRRGWLGVLALVMLSPPPVHAFTWQDLWLRQDQQASRLLAQGDAAAAAGRFQDPGWRATAQYRAGDYAAAAENFHARDSDSAYNRGNALARAGKLHEALAAYETALEQDAGNADARFNRDLVEKLQQQAQSGQAGHNDSQQQKQGQSGETGQKGAQQQPSATRAAGQDAGAGQHKPADEPGSRSAQGEQQQAAPHNSDKSAQGAAGSPGEQSRQDGTGATPQPHRQQDRGAQRGGKSNPSRAQDNSKQAQGAGQPSVQTDNAARARADVAPAAAADARAAAQQPGSASAPQGVSPGDQSQQALTEQDIALQQWLHQVPDDPAGLLRRKFMLEHLLRQKGRQTP